MMLPPPPQWPTRALIALMAAAFVLIACLALATTVTDAALRDALGRTAIYGSMIVWPAFFAVCVIAVGVRVWRHFSGWQP